MGGMTCEGWLYKQRDEHVGFIKRWFVLAGHHLGYYMDPLDKDPRRATDISGCQVTRGEDQTGNGEVIYQFVVQHEEKGIYYVLGTDTEHERDRWMRSLKDCSLRLRFLARQRLGGGGGSRSPSVEPVDPDQSTSSRNSRRLLKEETDSVASSDHFNSEEDLQDVISNASASSLLDRKFADKWRVEENAMNEALTRLFKLAHAHERRESDEGGETEEGEEREVICRVPGAVAARSQLVVEAKGEQALSHLLYRLPSGQDFDPSFQAARLLYHDGHQTSVWHLRFTSPWPFAPRDFCLMMTWRHVLRDSSRALCVADETSGEGYALAITSVMHPLCPTVPGVVRGHLPAGGYTFFPVGDSSCLVTAAAAVWAPGLGHLMGIAPPFARPEALERLRESLSRASSRLENFPSLTSRSLRSLVDLPFDGSGRQLVVQAAGGRQEERPKMFGWLYKRRDHMNGTRKRWFELKGSMLRYYIHPHDNSPRGSLDLHSCLVSVKNISEGSAAEQSLGLFLIVIYLSSCSRPTVLGVSSRRIRDRWARMLIRAAQAR